MQNLLVYLLDILFPPSEDATCIRGLREQDIPLLLYIKVVGDVTVLSDFNNKRIRALVHEAKFYDNRKAMQLLGLLVSLYLKQHAHHYDIIIPIPLSSTRMRERGYNQVHEVLKRSPYTKDRLLSTTLTRTRNTTPQTKLGREERLKNLTGAFAVKRPVDIVGKHVLIVDDVLTTGATLHEAKTALMRHSPASVTCLAFAH